MKNNIILFLFLILCSQSYAQNVCRKTNLCVWPQHKLPVNFTMDKDNIPGSQAPYNLLPNNNSTRYDLIDSMQRWNGNNYFKNGPILGSISFGHVTSVEQERNGKNEIMFNYWADEFGDKAGVAYLYVHPTDTLPTEYSQNTKVVEESDIFINPFLNYFLGETPPNNCVNQGIRYQSIDTLITHEMGHALGHARHIDKPSRNLMFHAQVDCDYADLTPNILKSISSIYPSNETVNITIQTPPVDSFLIGNQPVDFSALMSGPFKNKLSKEELKRIEEDLVWVSNVDGHLGTGNNFSVSNLSGGFHDLTVKIGKPGDKYYGENSSRFFIVDTVSDIVDPFGRIIAYPFPCVRHVDHGDNACLFTVLDSVDVAPQFLEGCSEHPIRYDHDPYPFSEDYLPNGQGERFYIHKDPIPRCDASLHYDDSRREYFAYSSWVYDSINANSVNFHLYSQINKTIGIHKISNTYFHNMPLVDPEIHVEIPTDCNVTNVTEECGVEINWSNKYFVPDAGVFYKANGSTDWSFVGAFTDNNSGTLRTSKVVGVNGGQIMVVQYSHDVRTTGSNTLLIDAPSGLLAGPFPVKAISSNTTPTDPDLQSANTTCSNNYCIELSGQYFGPNAYVDIRADLGTTVDGDFLGRISGNDIYSRSDTHIMFPIQDLDLQNRLTNSTYGLCFWVVDPPEFSDGHCVKRPSTPAQPRFMGQTVQKVVNLDVEHTSFEVKNNGTELEIWGNSWKKIANSYAVTPNTVLEFQFKSTQQQAGINGVGFIMNGSSTVASSNSWQVYGTRTDWGNQTYHNYSGSAWKTYRIPIGQTFTGDISHMAFIGYENPHVGQDVIYKNPKLVEDIPTPIIESVIPTCKNNYCLNILGRNFDANASVVIRENKAGATATKEFKLNDIYSRSPLNGKERLFFPTRTPSWQTKFKTSGLCFKVKSLGKLSNEVCKVRPITASYGTFMDSIVESYSNQDHEYDAFIVKYNNVLKIWGNSWKKITKNYNVTPNTVLEFEFISNNQEAGINGIGFIMEGSGGVSQSRAWQVYGTKTWGNQSYNNYSGTSWKTYRIPIGQSFTGQISNIVFAGDEDVHKGQNTIYKNVKLVESVPQPVKGFSYDPGKSGHGIHISQNQLGNYLMYFYTYDQSGQPEWYMSSGAVYNFNQLSGNLLKVSYNHSTSGVSTTNAGTFSINYSSNAVNGNSQCNGLNTDSRLGVFNWSISGQSGSWCLTPLFVESDGSPRYPAVNSGVWYQPSGSGWGISKQTRLELGNYDSYSVVYYYDAWGRARWSSGYQSGGLEDSYEFNLLHYNGYARTTTGSTTNQINGSLDLDFGSSSTADLSLNYPIYPYGSWNRNNVGIIKLAD